MVPFLDNLSSFPRLVDKIQITPEQGHRSFKVWHWSLFAASQATITFPNNRWCNLMLFPIKITLHRLFLYLEYSASIWKIVLLDLAQVVGLLLVSCCLLHCRFSCSLVC